jgi:hypothetical protein
MATTSYVPSTTSLQASLKLTGTVKGTSVNRTKNHTIKDVRQFATFESKLLNTDAPTKIWANSVGAGKGAGETDGFSWMMITNTGDTALEIFQEYPIWAAGTPDTGGGSGSGAPCYVTSIISPGSFITVPTQRVVKYDTLTSAANSAQLTGVTHASQLTDGNGYASTSTLFSQTDTGGICPGSIMCVFYKPPYQELGMTNSTNNAGRQLQTTSTGLAVNTAYRFGLNLNGAGAADVAFTTHATDITWGNGAIGGNGVLSKMNTALRDSYYAGTHVFQARVALLDGDVRFTSGSALSTAVIALSAPGSGVTMFGVGNIPAIGSIETAVTAVNATFFVIDQLDPADALIDYGDGTGTRANGGTFKFIENDGVQKYKESGLFELFNCPPHSSFKLWATYSGAHAGVADSDGTNDNVLTAIYARTLSKLVYGYCQVTVVG